MFDQYCIYCVRVTDVYSRHDDLMICMISCQNNSNISFVIFSRKSAAKSQDNDQVPLSAVVTETKDQRPAVTSEYVNVDTEDTRSLYESIDAETRHINPHPYSTPSGAAVSS